MKSKLKLAALGAAPALTPILAQAQAVIDVDEQVAVVESAVGTAGTVAVTVLTIALALFAVGFIVRIIRKAGRSA